jgi:hypothetical protein
VIFISSFSGGCKPPRGKRELGSWGAEELESWGKMELGSWRAGEKRERGSRSFHFRIPLSEFRLPPSTF